MKTETITVVKKAGLSKPKSKDVEVPMFETIDEARKALGDEVVLRFINYSNHLVIRSNVYKTL